ncbi:MAG TPA: hypothetical protein VF557_20545 [Jatrophihabitans sp.]|uniref:hypothetical protein n=1 Tax=Jatrophihabitans sp. TaxID=1932789 RepID=UPI002F051CDF
MDSPQAGQQGDPREVFRHLPFPFPGGRFPANLGAVVQVTVLRGDEPARLVIHDSDGSWLVGDGMNDPNEPAACVVTHMAHVVEQNSSVAMLATMPPGNAAERRNPGELWIVEPHVWDEDD